MTSRSTMRGRQTTVLITGFGPFPGVASNASSALASELASIAANTFAGCNVLAEILPTEWTQAPVRLSAILDAVKPALVLHFGVSAKARGFEIETRATNASCAKPDAAGALPDVACLDESGPTTMASGLDAREIVDRLRRRGLPAHVSHDAGDYICNAVLYHSLKYAAQCRHDMLAGFVHLPDCLAASGNATPMAGGAAQSCGCPLDWPGAISGSLEIIAAALGHPPTTTVGD